MLMRLWLPILLTVTPMSQSKETNNPYHLMQQVVSHTFDRLQKEQHLIEKDPNYLRNIVREELMPYIHIRYVGALILGPYFKSMDQAQYPLYFQALDDYLEQVCAQLLTVYNQQPYQIEPEKSLEQAKVVSIRMHLLPEAAPPMRVDFKWRKNSKTYQWQVYDILVEGVSMVATKQQEWSNLLHKGGIELLIKQLQLSTKQPMNQSK